MDTVGIEPKRSDCKSVYLPLASGPFRAGEGTRTPNNQFGRLELYQLSYSRNCDYSLGSFVTFYVNGVIKPTNITSVSFNDKLSPQNVSVLSPKTE